MIIELSDFFNNPSLIEIGWLRIQYYAVTWVLSAVFIFQYLKNQGLLSQNPASHVQLPKHTQKLPAVLDADQTAKLLEFVPKNGIEFRDKAILELLYGCGVRLTELVTLDIEDVDLVSGYARVIGKGNKERQCPCLLYTSPSPRDS